ncbi:MAG: Xaa-Pro peptidase family protein [Candidatus Acidiferrales bacterium]
MPDIPAIQAELRASKTDGWLFCDILHRDPLAYRILGLNEGMAKRRWFYLIPARGQPRKLVHRIEAGMLDSLPGAKQEYVALTELERGLARLLAKTKTLAMQYSPRNNIPYIAMVDAGTVELVRSLGKRVVSSADLVQKFEASWTPEQLESHLEAGKIVDRVTRDAFTRAGAFVRERKPLSEYDLQQWMMDQFRAHQIRTDSPPIVAVGPHSGNPHYEPSAKSPAQIREGDLLLLDVWGKFEKPASVYYDVTWTGYLGRKVPEKYSKIFQIVKQARDRAVSFVQESVVAGRAIHGWEVDNAAREVIRKAGYGKYFMHRTGHNIGQEVHGNGANMDGLEMKDDRKIVPRTCFSVEPGIYLPEFGIRSEVNVYVGEREARVTGAVQEEIIPILA